MKAKHQVLIKKRESTGLKHVNDSKSFIEYSVVWMILTKILKNMIADMLSNKKVNPTVTELFMR